MELKEIVLTSQEAFNDFEVNGERLTRDTYLKMADKIVLNYYLDVKDGEAYMCITLED